jgi:hypothetical protein
MSGDPAQEYFADGVVEDITTALSRFRNLFVIARNSSFTYKGRAVDVKQVGRELGVRYVLEGSVRKAGDRLRISGQLVDASTGATLWADRFDGAFTMRGGHRSTTWQKGCPSPNPGGRPKALHDLQELARQHTEAAIKTLAEIMKDEKAPHSARISASEALLSRGWGRPVLPTVQANAGHFEQWLDEMNAQLIDDGTASQNGDGLAGWETDGSA